MNHSRELIFFFSALGAFNGILLSSYLLLVAGKKHIGNFFLGMALMMLSIRAGKSVFYYFNDHLAEYFIQVGLIACFLIGPFLYFFVYTVQDLEHRPPPWKFHLMILLSIILGVSIFLPYYEYYHIWSHQLVLLIYLQWLIYLICSIWLILSHIKSKGKQGKLSPVMKWATQVTAGITLVCLAYLTAGYTSYIVGALTFSVITYLLILFLLNTRKNQVFLLNKRNPPLHKKENLQSSLEKMEALFTQEKIYKQASLKAADVALAMGIPNYQLSQIINEGLGMNFNSYVNKYRVQEAKLMLRSKPGFTIEAIGEECGFKSKSSFYAAFKKETGTTPSKFV